MTYALENMTVRMSLNDNLLLNKIEVYLDHYDKADKIWNAEEVAEILAGSGEFNFDIPGDSTKPHEVRLYVRMLRTM